MKLKNLTSLQFFGLCAALAGLVLLGTLAFVRVDRAQILVGTVVFGVTMGNSLMLHPLLLAERFGTRDYGRIYSTSQLVTVPTAALRDGLSRAARDHVRRHHDLAATVDRLMDFLEGVLAGKDRALLARAAERAREGSLLAQALEEVRWAARDLGLAGAPAGVAAALQDLLGPAR